MRRELGIAHFGLACCLCSENKNVLVVILVNVQIKNGVIIINVLLKKDITACYLCKEEFHKGLLNQIKPYGFTLFIKRYGIGELLDCLERNEIKGVVYHREGINGDYDDFDNVEELISFIKSGIR